MRYEFILNALYIYIYIYLGLDCGPRVRISSDGAIDFTLFVILIIVAYSKS